MNKISRSKIELFTDCPRCFWLDQVKTVKRPSGPAFTLNSAVDHLLKKEFDAHRAVGESHPMMRAYGLNAIPFLHEDMDKWRHNFTGVQFHHPETEFLVYGAVDDIWITPDKTLHIVDYKSTSKEGEVELTDAKWHNAYRRQMEVYQWLLRQNGFKVSDTGYFVYANGKKDRAAFDGKLDFDVKIIEYTGNADWIEPTLLKIRECLDSPTIPELNSDCEFCKYRQSASSFEHD
jgi:CRISPR/Cas system-associated exonuclease Cas4 (RecB family)